MALFPCDVCKRRYTGAGNSAYIGWMAGSYSERAKRRLCPTHMDLLRDHLDKHWRLTMRGDQELEVSDDTGGQCWRCKTEQASVMHFAYLYERTRDPEEYTLYVCKTCDPKVSQERPIAG